MDETKEVAVDIDTEVEETTDSNKENEIDEENEDSVEETQEDTVDLELELEKANEAKAQILARAKKAEAELKKLKKVSTAPITTNPQLSEELKLIARGLSDEEIEKAKIIAKGNSTSLQEALKDDMFISYQASMAEKKKKEDAKLGASKGSGESQEESDITPDMTREDHIKAFKKIMG